MIVAVNASAALVAAGKPRTFAEAFAWRRNPSTPGLPRVELDALAAIRVARPAPRHGLLADSSRSVDHQITRLRSRDKGRGV